MGEKLEGRKANGKKGLRRDRLDWLKGWREARHEGRKAGGEKVAKGKSGQQLKDKLRICTTNHMHRLSIQHGVRSTEEDKQAGSVACSCKAVS